LGALFRIQHPGELASGTARLAGQEKPQIRSCIRAFSARYAQTPGDCSGSFSHRLRLRLFPHLANQGTWRFRNRRSPRQPEATLRLRSTPVTLPSPETIRRAFVLKRNSTPASVANFAVAPVWLGCRLSDKNIRRNAPKQNNASGLGAPVAAARRHASRSKAHSPRVQAIQIHEAQTRENGEEILCDAISLRPAVLRVRCSPVEHRRSKLQSSRCV